MPPLLRNTLQPPHSARRVRRIFDDANEADRIAALSVAADLLVASGTPREQVFAESVFKTLLGCPPAKAASQDAAISAMLSRIRRGAGGDRTSTEKTYRAAA